MNAMSVKVGLPRRSFEYSSDTKYTAAMENALAILLARPENSLSNIFPTHASTNKNKHTTTVRMSHESNKPPGRIFRSKTFSLGWKCGTMTYNINKDISKCPTSSATFCW
eukprot:CAMPEP_0177392894 /NCGR_PEP_ID=MMETSP0368-20130122/54649_1 /TAXON_ID=447022 ORGANISM="Scrippsiella hangoei-like, Strain SHHI-4" /NCGR_SAMPLE_ID=MMETSP0368 /ASSEMBLY_ACC=CAM_ASM_000363 /LENGTH=109 /DNA_ID=CAMNT_0018859017 /DNA_START=18 /DNA_END=347 /DNA_ORIENTATION=-